MTSPGVVSRLVRRAMTGGLLALAGLAAAEPGPATADLTAAESSTDWLLPNHGYAARRHAPLRQITPDNVAGLRPVCTYRFDDTSRFGATPLVHRGVMYVPSGNATVALDAATCRRLWRHDWQPGLPPSALSQRRPVTNAFKSRGVALKDGRLVRATPDGQLIALDAATGTLLWTRPVASERQYEFAMMAPLAYDDLVITGIGISEFGIRGWIGAFRLADGEPVWRFNTVPAEGEPGADTWGDAGALERGGGGVWVTPSLDPQTGLLYAAVGNPGPDFHGDTRPGANLYTGSMIVLDARTGALSWHRQFVPHDLHDWDLTVAGPLYGGGPGGTRPMVAAGGKDGLLRGVDIASHQTVFETPVTTRLEADQPPTVQGVRACPGVLGGMQWSPPALDPTLGLLIAPAVDWCGIYSKTAELRFIRGQLYMGGSFSFDPLDQARGVLTAVDATTGAVRWRYESSRPMLAAVTTTASSLVFTGELTGHLLALDGRDGRVLLRHDTGMPLHAGVITYAVNGTQYVAVASGTATGFWRAPTAESAVMVFALSTPGSAPGGETPR
ncbi:MAG: PQQ-binding-like beta-propeller repeat protein [Betaproteobacteria bacterium]